MVWKEVALNFDNKGTKYYIEQQTNNGDGIIEYPLLLSKQFSRNLPDNKKETEIQKNLSSIGLAPKINKNSKQIKIKTLPNNNSNHNYSPPNSSDKHETQKYILLEKLLLKS